MKKTIIILICVIILAVGISFIKINITQEQHAQQDQTSIQNQITQVTTIVWNGDEIKNIKWVIEDFTNRSQLEKLDDWQKVFCKVFISEIYKTAIYYPVADSQVITNTSIMSNTNRVSQVQTNEVKFNFFENVFGRFFR
jgi:DNA primase catalytic subunit